MTSPYNVRDSLTVFCNNLKGPSNSNRGTAQFIPQQHAVNVVKPLYSILFLGDFLSIKDHHIEFDDRLKALAEKSDYLVINLEGIMTDEPYKSLFYQINMLERFLNITDLKSPENIIVSVANNHSADHGYDTLKECIQLLSDRGFRVVGTKEEPSLRINEDISIAAVTEWSNQRNDYLAELDDVKLEKSMFNILFPHWGHELELHPRDSQVEHAKGLLERWDMIVGHHSHTPQAVSSYQYGKLNKLVAYSLGDFATQFKRSFYRYGAVLFTEIGLVEGRGSEDRGLEESELDGNKLAVGNAQWLYSYCNRIGDKKIRIELSENCQYF